MTGLWSRLISRMAGNHACDPLLSAAVERSVYRVEPRLKQIRGFPGRYRPFIEPVLARVRQLATSVPGPVTVDTENYIRDPFVHALFGSPEDIRRFLCSTQTMRDHVARHGAGELYALLSMRRTERTVFGMEATGEVLRRDVAQQTVSFSDHQLIGLAPTEAEARENLLWYLFDRYMDHVAGGLDLLRAEQQRLVQQKDLALARLRGVSAGPRVVRQKELDKVLAQLAEATASLDLERLVDVFEVVLSHPEDCLALKAHSLAVDAMGVIQADAGNHGGARLDFVDLLERDREPRSVVLVHCRQVLAILPAERLQEAKQWLG
ncbi:MAG: hypothetical protein B7Y41_11680 [Hydrogenophilales bacterium 28-61-23]|nr:MAG: hypothetical protein B7Y41_11680 [Hydrogenophilales bacterium 28-61-23]